MTPWLQMPLELMLRTSACQQDVLERLVRSADLIAEVDMVCAPDRLTCELTLVRALAGDVPEHMRHRSRPDLGPTFRSGVQRMIVFGTIDPPPCLGITWPAAEADGVPSFVLSRGPPHVGEHRQCGNWHGEESVLRRAAPPGRDAVAVGLPQVCPMERRPWGEMLLPSASWTEVITAIERQVAVGDVGARRRCPITSLILEEARARREREQRSAVER